VYLQVVRRFLLGAAGATALAAAAAIGVLVRADTSDDRLPPRRATPTITALPAREPKGLVVDCSMHSEARFRHAFEDRARNIVAGPLALVGGA
jgi:hypothetical protein